MSIKTASVPILLSLIMMGCSGGGRHDGREIVSPSDAFLIAEEDQASVLSAANQGDLKAIRRLIAHYDALSGYDEHAERWKERARELGDAQELYNHASRLFLQSHGELDPERRRMLLGEALKLARRSNESRASSSAWKLIDEISGAIEGGK